MIEGFEIAILVKIIKATTLKKIPDSRDFFKHNTV